MRLTTKQREELYDACKGEREFPPCALCGLPIFAGQQWDVSHDKYLPGALGGKVDGISHRRCNRLHNNRHDTPLVAKRKRIRQKHIGAYRVSRPMIGARESDIKLHFGKPPTWRDSGRPLFKR
jgi:hypothetical protein